MTQAPVTWIIRLRRRSIPESGLLWSNTIRFTANPHTTSHLAGIEAGRAVEAARRKIARSISGDARAVVFTSGATEANNLALFGRGQGSRRATQDSRLRQRAQFSDGARPCTQERRFEIELVPVGSEGIVDLEALERAVDKRTVLVSAMHVNNETGVIQPIAEIAEICHRHGALLHSDCAQSLGRLPLSIGGLGADLLTLSAHKCYGPKGIGALYINARRKVALKPLYRGGGQEGGLRPGTLPVPLCVGFGEACRIAAQEFDADSERLDRLAGDLLKAILDACPTARLNGSWTHRVPGAFNVCFKGATGDELLSASKESTSHRDRPASRMWSNLPGSCSPMACRRQKQMHLFGFA